MRANQEKVVACLRVMTLNTLYRPPLERRRIEMAAWMNELEPHVVCLQEVQTDTNSTSVADWLAANLDGDWHVALGDREDQAGTRSGNAVLSRWPIQDTRTFDLCAEDHFPKVMLHARTAGIDVYCVHLTADPGAARVREDQVLVIDEAIRTTADPDSALPPVLAGDFNTGPGSSVIGFLRGERSLRGRSTFFQDAWEIGGDGGPGVTWDHANPLTPPAYLYDARCDFIFVGLPKVPIGWSTGAREDLPPVGQVTAARLACHESRTGVFASDHYGVVAEILCPAITASFDRAPESA